MEVDKQVLEFGTSYTITFIEYAADDSFVLASARAVIVEV